LFRGSFSVFGFWFGEHQMTSAARGLYLAQRVGDHLRLRNPVGVDHQPITFGLDWNRSSHQMQSISSWKR